MKKYLFLFIVSFIIISCKNKQKKLRYNEKEIASLGLNDVKKTNINTDSITRINLNSFIKDNSFNFGSLVEEIKFIPLETTNKSLLDNIRKIIVTNSNIFIHDDFKDGGIVIFDNYGKFIKRIENGKGPGELLGLYDISFDENENELIAYQKSFLFFYNRFGEFIRYKKLPLGFHRFTTIKDGYILKTLGSHNSNAHLGDIRDNTLLITDKNFKIKTSALPYPVSNVNLEGKHYLHKNKSLHVTQKFTDTIYEYKDELQRLKASYVIDYSEKKLPRKYTLSTMNKFNDATKKNDYYFYLGEYLDTPSHHAFFLQNWYKKHIVTLFRDKKSGNIIGGTRAKFNSQELPPIAFPKFVSGDYFISTYLPKKDKLQNSTIISKNDKIKIKNLKQTDNPTLVFFKLKKF